MNRTQILASHGLSINEFDTKEEAWDNADKLIELAKDEIDDIEQYPDKIFDGFKQLDQFYYKVPTGRLYD